MHVFGTEIGVEVPEVFWGEIMLRSEVVLGSGMSEFDQGEIMHVFETEIGVEVPDAVWILKCDGRSEVKMLDVFHVGLHQ